MLAFVRLPLLKTTSTSVQSDSRRRTVSVSARPRWSLKLTLPWSACVFTQPARRYCVFGFKATSAKKLVSALSRVMQRTACLPPWNCRSPVTTLHSAFWLPSLRL